MFTFVTNSSCDVIKFSAYRKFYLRCNFSPSLGSHALYLKQFFPLLGLTRSLSKISHHTQIFSSLLHPSPSPFPHLSLPLGLPCSISLPCTYQALIYVELKSSTRLQENSRTVELELRSKSRDRVTLQERRGRLAVCDLRPGPRGCSPPSCLNCEQPRHGGLALMSAMLEL